MSMFLLFIPFSQAWEEDFQAYVHLKSNPDAWDITLDHILHLSFS